MSPLAKTRNAINKLDEKLPIPGWKAAWTGLVAAALPLANEILIWLGKDPLPESLMLNINVFLTSLIVIFIAMKATRQNRQYDGR
jgi:hypothetical protein